MLKDNFRIIKNFFRLVKGSKLNIFFLFFGSIMGHVLSLIVPLFAANIVLYVTEGNAGLAYLNIVYFLIAYTGYDLFWYLNYTSYSRNFSYSYTRLRERIIDKIFTYDMEYEKKISKGTILNTVNGDTASLAEMIDQICEFLIVFVKVIVIVIIFLNMNPIIGLIALIIEFLYIKLFDFLNKKSTKHLRGQQKYRDKLTDNLSQILNGLPEIKTFNIYDKIKSSFYVIANRWSKEYMSKRKYMDLRSGLVPMVSHIGKGLLYAIMALLVLKGYYEINILVLSISYFEKLMADTKDLMGYSRQLREREISITRIDKLLNYTGEFMEEFGTNENDLLKGLVEFKNVSFAYKSANRGNINKISFKAKPNEITALVGHSGSGKTTIINLLLRKYKLDSGEILIDGESIYDYTKEVYASNVVGVNQSPFIFNMSIKKNLSLIDSNFDRQVDACKRVGLHDYIMSLPKGYNTVLSENAKNFSGGQRQLLAIARTLLSSSEILIFDEVTSSLDPILVEKIKGIFENLKIDHTIIIITHKKDVMRLADKIVVLNKGKIVGEGTHEELMKNNPFYIDLQTNNYSSSHKKPDYDITIAKEEEEEIK